MGTNSANPDKLHSYATDGLEMVETLRTEANAVADALGTLPASGGRHVPSLGDADTHLNRPSRQDTGPHGVGNESLLSGTVGHRTTPGGSTIRSS